MEPDLDELLTEQRGVISVRQALRYLSRATLRHRYESGRWRLAHRGILITHHGTLTDEQRRWVASLAAGSGEPALLGGVTALAVQGLDGFRTRVIHVLLPAGRQEEDPPSGVVVHRTRSLPEEDVHPRRRPPCTRVPRSIADAASWARSDREAALIVVMAFQQRLVRLHQVEDVLLRMPKAKRRRLVLATARDADGGSHSLAELDAVRLLRRAKLPTPSRQAVRRDSMGRRRYLDLYFDEWGLHVEIDGRQHDDPWQVWLDMDRQNALWTQGKREVRFTTWIVRAEPKLFVSRIGQALRELGWRG